MSWMKRMKRTGSTSARKLIMEGVDHIRIFILTYLINTNDFRRNYQYRTQILNMPHHKIVIHVHQCLVGYDSKEMLHK